MGYRLFPGFFKAINGIHTTFYIEKLRSSIDRKTSQDLSRRLGLAKPLAVMEQVHSNSVLVIKSALPKKQEIIQGVDALITKRDDVILGVYSGDCVAALCFDQEKRVIAVFHAGYNGILSDISGKVIYRMIHEFDSNPRDILIQTAPAIQSCCYNVSDARDNRVQRFSSQFGDDAIVKQGSNAYLDLRYALKRQLTKHKISRKNMLLSRECTACSENDYPSHYRTKFIEKKKQREYTLFSTIELTHDGSTT
ncbi:polyphenol oxidase family protein [Patescibacteria group bacterium]|nr:polyphenol oxidase family protein [Patescibacteria group bacterium]